MICPETRERLHAYLDDELDADQRPAFEEHLRVCSECSRERDAHQALRAGLREGDFGYSAPAGLRRRASGRRCGRRPDARRGRESPRP